MADGTDDPPLHVPGPSFSGGNTVRLLCGGDMLFPAMEAAIDAALHEVWLASYIFFDDRAGQRIADALQRAADRGVRVHVVIDGFGSKAALSQLQDWLRHERIRLAVFRPLHRWWAWMQPGQLRRLHQKLAVVDHRTAFVGGINVIDDRHDLHHGWTDQPRLDFAVQIEGPLVAPIAQTTRAMWTRAALGREWGSEVVALARSAEPVHRARRLLQRLRITRRVSGPAAAERQPMRAALVVRDNLLQRRAIERAYVQAIRDAREQVDIACPYFYPGRVFRRVLRQAARRGVRVRLLLQGKVDYRIAALAAQALYDELLGHGIEVYEYTPAFLHAKVAVVDGHWATVGSSNIDPISLLLNLEANVVVEDQVFAGELRAALEHAMSQSHRVAVAERARTPWALLRRGLVAWCASTYLRMAGITGRY